MMTLAALKRAVGGGATLTLRRYEVRRGLDTDWRPAGHPHLDVPRTGDRCQTVSVRLQPGGSWLTYGKASAWEFEEIEGGTLATVTDVGESGYGVRMTYEVAP